MSKALRTEATDETQGFMKAIIGANDRISALLLLDPSWLPL
jgi:hypothetical protein